MKLETSGISEMSDQDTQIAAVSAISRKLDIISMKKRPQQIHLSTIQENLESSALSPKDQLNTIDLKNFIIITNDQPSKQNPLDPPTYSHQSLPDALNSIHQQIFSSVPKKQHTSGKIMQNQHHQEQSQDHQIQGDQAVVYNEEEEVEGIQVKSSESKRKKKKKVTIESLKGDENQSPQDSLSSKRPSSSRKKKSAKEQTESPEFKEDRGKRSGEFKEDQSSPVSPALISQEQESKSSSTLERKTKKKKSTKKSSIPSNTTTTFTTSPKKKRVVFKEDKSPRDLAIVSSDIAIDIQKYNDDDIDEEEDSDAQIQKLIRPTGSIKEYEISWSFLKFIKDRRIRIKDKILFIMSVGLICSNIGACIAHFVQFVTSGCFGYEAEAELIDYMNISISVILKFCCINIIMQEITNTLPGGISLPFLVPMVIMGVTPVFQLNQYVYSFQTCEQLNPVFSFGSARTLTRVLCYSIMILLFIICIFTTIIKVRISRGSWKILKNAGFYIFIGGFFLSIIFIFIFTSVIQLHKQAITMLILDNITFWIFFLASLFFSVRKLVYKKEPFSFEPLEIKKQSSLKPEDDIESAKLIIKQQPQHQKSIEVEDQIVLKIIDEDRSSQRSSHSSQSSNNKKSKTTKILSTLPKRRDKQNQQLNLNQEGVADSNSFLKQSQLVSNSNILSLSHSPMNTKYGQSPNRLHDSNSPSANLTFEIEEETSHQTQQKKSKFSSMKAILSVSNQQSKEGSQVNSHRDTVQQQQQAPQVGVQQEIFDNSSQYKQKKNKLPKLKENSHGFVNEMEMKKIGISLQSEESRMNTQSPLRKKKVLKPLRKDSDDGHGESGQLNQSSKLILLQQSQDSFSHHSNTSHIMEYQKKDLELIRLGKSAQLISFDRENHHHIDNNESQFMMKPQKRSRMRSLNKIEDSELSEKQIRKLSQPNSQNNSPRNQNSENITSVQQLGQNH